ncbi:hypothetical protein PO909_030317 [Leuciscus waleckii]
MGWQPVQELVVEAGVEVVELHLQMQSFGVWRWWGERVSPVRCKTRRRWRKKVRGQLGIFWRRWWWRQVIHGWRWEGGLWESRWRRKLVDFGCAGRRSRGRRRQHGVGWWRRQGFH